MASIEQGISGADLSSSQYLAVYSDGTDDESVKLLVSDTAVTGLGLLVNDPVDTALAKYAFEGFATGIAGAAISPHDELMVNGSGKLIVATSGKVVIGKFMPKPRGTSNRLDAAANDEIRVFLYPNKTRTLA